MSLVSNPVMESRISLIEPLPLLPNEEEGPLTVSKVNVEIRPSMVSMTSSPSFCQVMEGRGKPVVRQTRVAGQETLTSVRLETLLIMGQTRVERREGCTGKEVRRNGRRKKEGKKQVEHHIDIM